jgi:hypothetical protein
MLHDQYQRQDLAYVLRTATLPVTVWFFVFWGVQWVVQHVVLPRIPFAAGRVSTPEKRFMATNSMVSCSNSVLQSILTVPLWLGVQWGYEAFFEAYVESFVCCFLGYLLQDLVAGLFCAKGVMFRQQPFLLLHHFVVIASLSLSLFTPYTLYYQVVATLCEVNSIFLHARSVLKLTSPGFARRFLKPVQVIQYITYLVFRLPSSLWLVPTALNYSFDVAGHHFWSVLAILLLIINFRLIHLPLLIRSDLRHDPRDIRLQS